MDAAEMRFIAGLLSGSQGTRTANEWNDTFTNLLCGVPVLLDEPGELSASAASAWEAFRDTGAGRGLLAAARYRIAWRDPNAAAQWAAGNVHLLGRGAYIEVTSPVEVVEWKWPLSVAVMPDAGFAEAQAYLTDLIESGPPWMKVLVHLLKEPADQAGTTDILIFPQGSAARSTLLHAAVPVSADLLVLCDLRPEQFGEAAATAESLLKLAQAHAVLLVDTRGPDMDWLRMLVEQLAHDQPLDMAVTQALAWQHWEPGRMLLLSTARFIREARLSAFVGSLTGRLNLLRSDHPIDLGIGGLGLPTRLRAVDAASFLKSQITFDHESNGASLAAAMASALPPAPEAAPAPPAPPAPPPVAPAAEPTRSTGAPPVSAPPSPAPGAGAGPPAVPEAAAKPDRYLLSKLIPAEPTTFATTEALEAGKRYALEVRIGRNQDGYFRGEAPMPEPPVRPEDAGVNLAVVFFERNSQPDAQLGTVFLPRKGESSTCIFEFVTSAASDVFEGWILLYHNNRLLQEGVLRARVQGGAATVGAQVPEKTVFSLSATPRPLALGLVERRIFGGTIRLESDDTVTATRGYQTRRVSLGGLKAAVDGLESALNRIPWEDMSAGWVNDQTAASRLATVAQQGWQLHEALCSNEVLKGIVESGMPVMVYAADANVRAPLELCYSMPQPKSTARICPRAGEAVAQGKCVEGCEGRQRPRDYVCPMAFWSLSKVIEWRSQAADSRDDGSLAAIANEPVPGRRALQPLTKLLVARSDRIDDNSARPFEECLGRAVSAWKEVKSWDEWESAVSTERPSMLVLMPHVDNSRRPPMMEIQSEQKDPPGIESADVVGDPPQQPVVVILGCGAATALVDFQSLPAQFRRHQAAAVIAPLAEVLAEDAPAIAKILVETLAEGPPAERPLGEVMLAVKRKLVAEGRLAGLLLLAFGDADWLV